MAGVDQGYPAPSEDDDSMAVFDRSSAAGVKDSLTTLGDLTVWQDFVLRYFLTDKVRTAIVVALIAVIAAASEAAVSWLETTFRASGV